MAKTIGIDLGTATTRIVVRGRGIVLSEPSVVATDEKAEEIIAVGADAAKMAGKTGKDIRVVRPLGGGAIEHCDEAEGMLEDFMSNAVDAFFGHPYVIASVPYGITEIEKRAVDKVLCEAGAHEVQLLDKVILSALGAGVSVMQPRGFLVIDIGAGTTDVAVISMGKIVCAQSIRSGGDAISAALIAAIRKKSGIIISESTAESIKKTVGTVYPKLDLGEMGVHGLNAATGKPDSTIIRSRDVFEGVSEPILRIVEAVRAVLEQTPPEMAADIFEDGICLTGGGAMMNGMVDLIADASKTKVYLADGAENATAAGLLKILGYRGDLRDIFLLKEV